LVDEYQDTNYSQNQIVFKLAEGSNNTNIFVVGDDDQIIYGFQGAQTDNLEKFLKRYPETKVICLNENNRSTQSVLDLSYEVITQDRTRLENNKEFAQYNISKKLTAKNQKIICSDKKVKLYGFGDPSQENNFIAEEIEKLIVSLSVNEEGEKDLSQIAILTKQNREIENFAELLKAKNIPFQIKSGKSIFELKPSILIYFYIKTLENHELYADKLFGILLAKPFDFELEDYNFLFEQNRLTHRDLLSNIRENISREWKNPDKVNNFFTTFEELRELKAHEPLKNLVVEIINQTGILEYYVNSEINRVENIAGIKRIVDEASSYSNLHKSATLQDFITHLDTAFDDDISICISKDDYIQNAVQLLTLHGAKGREFEYVFLPNLVSKNWEKKRDPNNMDLPIEKATFAGDDELSKKAEQLRLLFVGITRAKHSLFLSYSNSQNNKPLELTEYLASVAERTDILETKNHELKQDDLSFEIVKSLRKSTVNYTETFKDELKARISNFTFSPSTLNSYLNCPRSFLYSYLLQIPVKDRESEAAYYGSAIHKTLETATTQAVKTGNYPDEEEFIEMFIKKLSAQKFETLAQRKVYEVRGEKSLREYYSNLIQTMPDRIHGLEVKLDYVPIEDYFIKGFIDRIEKNNDGTFSLYDYKTGSAKSKSQIADGKDYEHYLNQLRFYKFAFETLHAGEKVSQVGLIYVEDFSNNFYTELCEEDNSIIKEKILNSYREIHDLSFAPTEKSDKSCGYCGYQQLCKLGIL